VAEIKEKDKRPTLDLFRRLGLSLPVSDGHWMSPEKEGGVIESRSPFLIFHALTAREKGFVRARARMKKFKNYQEKLFQKSRQVFCCLAPILRF